MTGNVSEDNTFVSEGRLIRRINRGVKTNLALEKNKEPVIQHLE